ncbi:hypothetical protein Bca101_037512 [Brassica carinata]
MKTFTGRRGRARNKLQIQRGSSNPIVFEVPDVSFPPTVHKSFKVPEVSITTKKKGSGFDEETVRREDEEETVVHRNEQEAMDSGENSSVEGDDCEVIVEDMAGYKEESLQAVEKEHLKAHHKFTLLNHYKEHRKKLHTKHHKGVSGSLPNHVHL